jgi:hypothetical protein
MIHSTREANVKQKLLILVFAGLMALFTCCMAITGYCETASTGAMPDTLIAAATAPPLPQTKLPATNPGKTSKINVDFQNVDIMKALAEVAGTANIKYALVGSTFSGNLPVTMRLADVDGEDAFRKLCAVAGFTVVRYEPLNLLLVNPRPSDATPVADTNEHFTTNEPYAITACSSFGTPAGYIATYWAKRWLSPEEARKVWPKSKQQNSPEGITAPGPRKKITIDFKNATIYETIGMLVATSGVSCITLLPGQELPDTPRINLHLENMPAEDAYKQFSEAANLTVVYLEPVKAFFVTRPQFAVVGGRTVPIVGAMTVGENKGNTSTLISTTTCTMRKDEKTGKIIIEMGPEIDAEQGKTILTSPPLVDFNGSVTLPNGGTIDTNNLPIITVENTHREPLPAEDKLIDLNLKDVPFDKAMTELTDAVMMTIKPKDNMKPIVILTADDVPKDLRVTCHIVSVRFDKAFLTLLKQANLDYIQEEPPEAFQITVIPTPAFEVKVTQDKKK